MPAPEAVMAPMEMSELLAAVSAATSTGLVVVDRTLPDMPIVFVNDAFCRLTGYSREEALGRNCRFLQGPGTDPAGIDRMRQAIQQTEACSVELLNYRRDGSSFWNAVRLAPVADAGGGPPRFFIGLQHDITEQRRANAALAASEARFREVLQIDTVGVMFWNSDGMLTEANDAFLHMTGFNREEALGLSWRKLTPEAFISRSEQALAELKAIGRTAPYEKPCVRKDGSTWWGLFAARQLGSEAVEFALDVSERKAAEAHQNLLMLELSHRVKNTLALILAMARQTGRRATGMNDFLDVFEGRLMALSAAHELLTASGWHATSLAALARRALALHQEDGAGRIRIGVEDVPLTLALA